MVKARGKKGFTLIELMIVVAIIGILAAIAIPKFSQLIAKGNEASTKGNLGSVRSALSIYYGDTEGVYPSDTLSSLTAGNGKYLAKVPEVKIPRFTGQNIGHATSNVVEAGNAVGTHGGWMFENDPIEQDWGRVFVDCDHNDSRGVSWSTY